MIFPTLRKPYQKNKSQHCKILQFYFRVSFTNESRLSLLDRSMSSLVSKHDCPLQRPVNRNRIRKFNLEGTLVKLSYTFLYPDRIQLKIWFTGLITAYMRSSTACVTNDLCPRIALLDSCRLLVPSSYLVTKIMATNRQNFEAAYPRNFILAFL